MNNESNNIKSLIILITLLIVLILGSTYAALNISITNKTSQIQAGCFKEKIIDDAIDASKLSSTTVPKEGAKTTVTLSKDADCTIYSSANIYIHTSELTTAPLDNPEALKFVVYDSNENEPPLNSGTINSIGDDTLLLENIELTTTPKSYVIYIYIDSDISAGYYNATTYSGRIYAESVQSSTITR